MKLISIVLTTLIAISCGIILSGCGATNWATREIPDGSSLDQGDLITIVQKDGNAYTGTYRGLTLLSPSEYAQEYSLGEDRIFDGKLLPKLGEHIRILTTISDSKIWDGELLGFDCSSLWMKSKNSSETKKIYFTSLRCLSARDGKVFHRMHLRNMFMDGDIPLMSALEIENAGGSRRVSVSSIDHIRLNGSGIEISGKDLLMGGW